MHFEIVAEGLAFPEGPVVCDDGSVIVVEIKAGRVTRVRPDGRTEVIANPGGGTNGAAIGPDGALYVCNNGGFAWSGAEMGLNVPGHAADDYEIGRVERIDLSTGRVERLFDHVDGAPLSGPNDIVFDASGGFWFTDLGKTRHRGVDAGGLFWAKPDGSVVKRAVHGPNMNGVGLSPDGRTVYTALTHERLLLGFDITGPGEVAPGPGLLPGRVVASFPGRTLLDSLAVAADGTVCVATLLDQPGIAEVDPATGAFTIHAFPDLLTTNIAFGGADMQDAWITLSTTGKLAKCRWPRPGLRLAF
jgi:gluconolactonase